MKKSPGEVGDRYGRNSLTPGSAIVGATSPARAAATLSASPALASMVIATTNPSLSSFGVKLVPSMCALARCHLRRVWQRRRAECFARRRIVMIDAGPGMRLSVELDIPAGGREIKRHGISINDQRAASLWKGRRPPKAVLMEGTTGAALVARDAALFLRLFCCALVQQMIQRHNNPLALRSPHP